MKNLSFLLACIMVALLLVSCKGDDDVLNFPDDIEGDWSLVSKTGGFAGVNCEYPNGDITFSFSDDEVVVANNFADTASICTLSLASGTYDYSILVSFSGNSNYLVINGVEWGLMEELNGMLSIDGSQQSTGGVADAFSYVLDPE
jgi:hypothetical protein